MGNECMGNSNSTAAPSEGEAAAARDLSSVALRRDTRSQPARQQKASARKSPTPSTAPTSAVFSSASVKDWRCEGSGESSGEGGGGGKDGSKLERLSKLGKDGSKLGRLSKLGRGKGGGGGGGGGNGRGEGGCKGGD